MTKVELISYYYKLLSRGLLFSNDIEKDIEDLKFTSQKEVDFLIALTGKYCLENDHLDEYNKQNIDYIIDYAICNNGTNESINDLKKIVNNYEFKDNLPFLVSIFAKRIPRRDKEKSTIVVTLEDIKNQRVNLNESFNFDHRVVYSFLVSEKEYEEICIKNFLLNNAFLGTISYLLIDNPKLFLDETVKERIQKVLTINKEVTSKSYSIIDYFNTRHFYKYNKKLIKRIGDIHD